MTLINTLRTRLRALTDADNTNLPRWQRALLYAIDLGRFAGHKLKQDRAPQMAAALTYHTLFSLLPTLVLTLVVAQAFVSEQQLDQLKGQVVNSAVSWLDPPESPSSEALEKNPTSHETQGSSDEHLSGFAVFTSAARRAAEQTQQHAQQQSQQNAANARSAEYARTADKLDDQLTLWLNQLQNVDFKSIGLIGILIFIYGATKLLATIESSFNLVLRAEENRSWYVRLPLYYTTLTLAPIVLLAGQWAQQQFLAILETGGAITAWIAGPFVVLSPLLTVWLVLLLAFRLLPNAALKIRPAAIGSFVAAAFLGLATAGFSYYVRHTGSTSLYGALAMLPLFLLLLWIVWQIVLFGLELASIIQFMPDRKTRQRDDAAPRFTDPRLLIPALVLFAQRFHAGESLEPETLITELQLPAAALEPMLATLKTHGYIHQLHDEDPRYALAKSPEHIALPDLLQTIHHLGRSNTDTITAPLQRLDHAEQTATQNQTLADLL